MCYKMTVKNKQEHAIQHFVHCSDPLIKNLIKMKKMKEIINRMIWKSTMMSSDVLFRPQKNIQNSKDI